MYTVRRKGGKGGKGAGGNDSPRTPSSGRAKAWGKAKALLRLTAFSGRISGTEGKARAGFRRVFAARLRRGGRGSPQSVLWAGRGKRCRTVWPPGAERPCPPRSGRGLSVSVHSVPARAGRLRPGFAGPSCQGKGCLEQGSVEHGPLLHSAPVLKDNVFSTYHSVFVRKEITRSSTLRGPRALSGVRAGSAGSRSSHAASSVTASVQARSPYRRSRAGGPSRHSGDVLTFGLKSGILKHCRAGASPGVGLKP